MNVDINEEFESESELRDFLYKEGFIVPYSGFTADVSIDRFLRDDKTINIELLEFSIKSACEGGAKSITVVGYDNYAILRGIDRDEEAKRQEFNFIMGLVTSLSTEYLDV